MAKLLGIGLALLWLAVLVWLGVVLVRLKAAGPDALRVTEDRSGGATVDRDDGSDARSGGAVGLTPANEFPVRGKDD